MHFFKNKKEEEKNCVFSTLREIPEIFWFGFFVS